MGKHIIVGLLLFFALGASFGWAQQAYLKGKAKGAENKVLSVNTYSDYLSHREKCLGQTLIDDSGNFEIAVPLTETSYVWLEVEYYMGETYLDPGTHHSCNIKGLVINDTTDRINSYLEPQIFYVIPDSSDQLNLAIRKFNFQYNRFLYNNYMNLQQRSMKKSIDSLQTVCDSLYKNIPGSFFKDYRRYRFASLYMMSGKKSREDLFYEYFLDEPILTRNIEYMSFFREYFDNYFFSLESRVSIDDLRLTVNEKASAPELFNLLGNDTLLKNEALRECVMLETLKVLYATSGFDRDNTMKIISWVAEHSKFSEHKKMAGNIIYELKRFKEGSPAPDFHLQDAAGDTVSMADLRGKYLYINFFTTWNIASISEMEVIRTLITRYGLNINFVSICCDRESMKMFHFSNDNKYPWPVLHFGNDYKLLKSFGVTTYPYFILIDPQGRFVRCPAESPSGNIEKRFKELLGG